MILGNVRVGLLKVPNISSVRKRTHISLGMLLWANVMRGAGEMVLIWVRALIVCE